MAKPGPPTRIALTALLLGAFFAASATAQIPNGNRAGVVVVHGDGRVVTACVPFEEEAISGAALLRRSGLAVSLDAYGGLGYGVCAIDGEGCPAGGDCFCQCRSTPCAYWVYSHRQPDGSWAVSGVGADAWQVHDGDVDGWVWGDGSATPPQVTFKEVCPAANEGGAAPETPTITAAPLPTPADQRWSAGPGLGLLAFGAFALSLIIWLVAARTRAR